jgi:hypothetical protein
MTKKTAVAVAEPQQGDEKKKALLYAKTLALRTLRWKTAKRMEAAVAR